MALWYFAYGSNMSEGVMSAQCPNHRFVGVAQLPDYRLTFGRRSVRTGTGVADVVPQPGSVVWGVVYEVDEEGLAALDRKEGRGWAYERRPVRVLAGDGRRPLEAFAYMVLEPEPDEVEPSPAYLDGLVAAARERGLPEAYVEELRRPRWPPAQPGSVQNPS